MFGNRQLKDEVNTLRSKLETLEHSEFGEKIEKLQKSNHKSKKAHQNTIEDLRKANLKLALKLSRLQGMAVVLFMMLSGIGITYFYHIAQYREIQPAVNEVLIDTFQNKLGDMIDRIILIAPRDEDKKMLKEVSNMRDQLSSMCLKGTRCDELSKLTKALELIVNEGKAQDASKKIAEEALTSSEHRFVNSRARLLQVAVRFHPDGLCTQPERTLELLAKVIELDSGLVAALNLEGVCLAQRSADLMKDGKLDDSIQKIHEARRDNEFAFQFKPSRWSKVRFFNNKVWEHMLFLSAALDKGKLDVALPQIEDGKYKDMEDFFVKSLIDIEECYSLSQDKATYLETEAELRALEYTYYTSNKYNNEDKANKADAAKKVMIERLSDAILNHDLLNIRQRSTLKDAEEYFRKDVLLTPIFDSSDKNSPLNDQIKALINDLLAHTK